MSYISEMRKFVSYAPIMYIAAMGILFNKEKGLLLEKNKHRRMVYTRWCN